MLSSVCAKILLKLLPLTRIESSKHILLIKIGKNGPNHFCSSSVTIPRLEQQQDSCV